jgi:hypothetical protein
MNEYTFDIRATTKSEDLAIATTSSTVDCLDAVAAVVRNVVCDVAVATIFVVVVVIVIVVGAAMCPLAHIHLISLSLANNIKDTYTKIMESKIIIIRDGLLLAYRYSMDRKQ